MLNMGGPFTLQIKNSFEAVRSAGTTMSHWLADQGAPEEIQNFANLVLEEFGTNSIKYGYDDANEHWIEVTLCISGGELIVNIIDDGRAFNPLEAPEPQLDIPIEERRVGGLGIYLVRKMSDRMEYVREGGKNRLTLHKAWPPQFSKEANPRD
jgi:anti-sigma regulatory factor (Ser/Thr protein kinase)